MMKTRPKLPLLYDYLEYWAERQPDKLALMQDEDGKSYTYRQLVEIIDAYALSLLSLGVQPGDRVAILLGLTPDTIALMYACFKIGAICATLDVRLKDPEVVQDLKKIDPRVFVSHGATPLRDFCHTNRLVRREVSSVEQVLLLPITPSASDSEALNLNELARLVRRAAPATQARLQEQLAAAQARNTPRTPALIIYTTGTTGAPKAAVLCHENILTQNEIFARGIAMHQDIRMLVNLPPSHVGGVTTCTMTCLYLGGTAVLQRCFEPRRTLEIIQLQHINLLAQIPTQYRLQWTLPGYGNYDLSSLEMVVCGGSSVDAVFLRRLAEMAPRFGCGLGMTETAGFSTFTPPGISVAEMEGQVGQIYADLAPVTVRAPMNPDGTAGPELLDGMLGEICHHPPLVFLGYFNQPEQTRRAISSEGILYSGDLGYIRQQDGYRAVYLVGRRKFIIKQSGYNVFPDEVEAHIARLAQVESVCVVGVDHELLGEGIFAFVRPQPGANLTPQTVHLHCKQIASYKRPLHVEIWPVEQNFPLNRTTKVDRLEMARLAEQIASGLRLAGGWDCRCTTPSQAS